MSIPIPLTMSKLGRSRGLGALKPQTYKSKYLLTNRNFIFSHSALSTALKFCGLDPTRYKGHSFRIGAATHAADKGMSDAQIRTMGRWKSNAFLKYIRLQSMSI